jgi:hypothetical protein
MPNLLLGVPEFWVRSTSTVFPPLSVALMASTHLWLSERNASRSLSRTHTVPTNVGSSRRPDNVLPEQSGPLSSNSNQTTLPRRPAEVEIRTDSTMLVAIPPYGILKALTCLREYLSVSTLGVSLTKRWVCVGRLSGFVANPAGGHERRYVLRGSGGVVHAGFPIAWKPPTLRLDLLDSSQLVRPAPHKTLCSRHLHSPSASNGGMERNSWETRVN